ASPPSSTPALRLARLTQLRVCAVLDQQRRGLSVEQHAAYPVSESRGGEPWRDARLADGVDVGPLVDEQFEEGIPSAVRGTEQGVLARRGDRLRIDAQAQQDRDGLDRLLLSDRAVGMRTI